MKEEKVDLLIKVRTSFDMVSEFNAFWEKGSLPIWIKHGAKHIGSFSNYVGDPINEIIRLFAFESIAQWDECEKFLADSPEGKALVQRLS